MRSWTAVLFTAAAAIGLGFVHPFGNPRVEPAKGLDTLLQSSTMPADARRVLVTKCADCHSNETRWPVYSRIAPGSWLIERDILEARKHMDLSQWEKLSPDRQDVLEAQIIEVAKHGTMPPLQYRLLHWGATLSQADVLTLSKLSRSSNMSETTPVAAGDATRGKDVFEKRCTGCHAMEADREGPRLAGVFGRKAGSIAEFNYSAGLKNSGLTWDDATLERWLTDPDMVVKDNNMSFSVPKAQERRDLISYFRAQRAR